MIRLDQTRSLFIFGTAGDMVDITSSNGSAQTVTIGAGGSVSLPVPLFALRIPGDSERIRDLGGMNPA